jgi:hypothetical protein
VLTLTPTLSLWFSRFEVFFEPVAGPRPVPHAYRIHGFLHRRTLNNLLPVARTTCPRRRDITIAPPSPRFLALHRAIARILHDSGAGEYVNQLLDDMEASVAEGKPPEALPSRLAQIWPWLDAGGDTNAS